MPKQLKILQTLLIFIILSCNSSIPKTTSLFPEKDFFLKSRFYKTNEKTTILPKPKNTKNTYQDFLLTAKVSFKNKLSHSVFHIKNHDELQKGYKITISPNKLAIEGLFFNKKIVVTNKLNQWHKIKILADGVQFHIYINEKKIFSFRDGDSRFGKIKTYTKEAQIQNLSIKKLNNNKTVTLNPQQAINSFEIVDKKLQLKLITTDKLISNPVTLKYDYKGQLWVIEMTGYMQLNNNKEFVNKPTGRISLLKDSNNDGIYDTRKTFLNNINTPRALTFFTDGILYADANNLYFIKKDKYDNPIGSSILIDPSYTSEENNVEHDSNALLRGIDNWIYSAKSTRRYKRVNNTWKIEKMKLRGQWGLSQDRYGRLFYTTNSRLVTADLHLPNLFMEKNIQYKHRLTTGFNSPVYSLINSPLNRGYKPNFLNSKGQLKKPTSVSGAVNYTAKNLPQKYHNSFIITEPSVNLIKALSIKENGSKITFQDMFKKTEFLRSYDRIFRPVDIKVAPDGALIFVDIYRGIIQDKGFLTDYLRKLSDHYHITNIMNLGRIYKIFDPTRPLDKITDLSKKNNIQLISLLGHHNQWWRIQAQNLLVESKNKTLKKRLIKNFLNTKNELTRIHTIWTLEGLGLMNEKLAVKFLIQKDNTPWVINHIFHSLKEQNHLDNSLLLQHIDKNLKHSPKFQHPYILQLLKKFNNNKGKELFKLQFKKNRNSHTNLNLLIGAMNPTKLQQKYNLQWPKHFKTNPIKNITNDKGYKLYKRHCSSCHGNQGEGLIGLAPHLKGSDWITNSKKRLIKTISNGLTGAIKINGKLYKNFGAMPSFKKILNNEDFATLVTTLRQMFGKKKNEITTEKEIEKFK